MNSNLAGTSESRLMLIRLRPASFNLGRSLDRFMPLVVTAMVFKLSSFFSSAVEHEKKEPREEEDSATKMSNQFIKLRVIFRTRKTRVLTKLPG